MSTTNIIRSVNPQNIKMAFNTFQVNHFSKSNTAITFDSSDSPASLIPFMNGFAKTYPSNITRPLTFELAAVSPQNTYLDLLQKYQRLAGTSDTLPSEFTAIFGDTINNIVFTFSFGDIKIATRAWVLSDVSTVSVPLDSDPDLVRTWTMTFGDEVVNSVGSIGV